MVRKTSIDDYKDRMTSPIGIVVTTKKNKAKAKPKPTKKKGK